MLPGPDLPDTAEETPCGVCTPVRAGLGHQAAEPPTPKGTDRRREARHHSAHAARRTPARVEAPVGGSAPAHASPGVWTPAILPRRDLRNLSCCWKHENHGLVVEPRQVSPIGKVNGMVFLEVGQLQTLSFPWPGTWAIVEAHPHPPLAWQRAGHREPEQQAARLMGATPRRKPGSCRSHSAPAADHQACVKTRNKSLISAVSKFLKIIKGVTC